MKNLASDNYSSVSPEILEFLSKVNTGHARAYGNDEITQKAKEVIKKELGDNNAAVYFMLTGTAANVLGIKHCIRSTDSILVPESSHINANEAGAPEAITQCELIQIPETYGKIKVNDVEKILLQQLDYIPHTPRPRMLSIAQATEDGTVYTIDELQEISDFCKRHNLLLHLDLCRVYNAAVALSVSLSSIIDAAKPDVVSLGGTKNGLMFAEAVVFFNDEFKDGFEIQQKQGMQLYSKMRYLAAQFIPFFEEGLWLRNAKQANEMCTYLYEKIKSLPGVEFTVPVQTNHMFLKIPKDAIIPLQELSPFYVWDINESEIRLVTSFDTTEEEIDVFASKLDELLS